LRKLIKGEDSVKHVKAQRIKWRGHLNKMGDIKLVKKITDWNPAGLRTKGRTKNRWRDKETNDLKKMKPRN